MLSSKISGLSLSIFGSGEYAAKSVGGLPYISGIKLKRSDGEYVPIEGVSILSELLDKTRERLPEIYADWQFVNCEDFNPESAEAWSVIKVKTRRMGEMVFRPRDFDSQLRRLETILSSMDQYDRQFIDMIDLTLEGRAAVRVASNNTYGSGRNW